MTINLVEIGVLIPSILKSENPEVMPAKNLLEYLHTLF